MLQKQDPKADQLSHHRDDILCLAVSKDRTKVVTGQVGKWPSVHIWDAVTAEKIDAFQLEKDSRGISAVGFSSCGRYIACVDNQDNHRITIYNIERKCIVLHQDGSKNTILSLAWSKRPDDLRLALVGPKEISFWNPGDVTKKLTQKGIFGKAEQTLLNCVSFDEEGWCFTGGQNGIIHVWGIEAKVERSIKAH